MDLLRTNGVNTIGVAAKAMFCLKQIGEKGTPWHFWEDNSRLTGVPKMSVKKHETCSDPISADPVCPFPNSVKGGLLVANT